MTSVSLNLISEIWSPHGLENRKTWVCFVPEKIQRMRGTEYFNPLNQIFILHFRITNQLNVINQGFSKLEMYF